jgi:lysyl-tRNA synthetase class 2
MTSTEEQQYETKRLYELTENVNIDPYPHKFQISISFGDYIKKYSDIEPGSRHRDIVESIAGRIIEKRGNGKKLNFYTVSSNGDTLQYLADINEYKDKEAFCSINTIIHRGDIVGVIGFVGKSLKGELSIYPYELKLLTPCFKFLPKQFFGVSDIETRMNKRYLDMIINKNTIDTLKIRSMIIKEIRNYLDNLNFIEIDTPILSTKFGGAVARPFMTHHNDLNKEMYMRIAPELYLKQLVIGGLDRVYEIGKQFRNEGLDSSHQCEFTSIEFYMSYVDYIDLMALVEDLLSKIVLKVKYNLKIEYDGKIIDFTPPFKRIHILDELEKQTGEKFDFEDFSSHEFEVFLNNLCVKHNIVCSPPKTISRMLDKLIGHFIEPQCIDPTFLTNHPLVMSPLAKHDRLDSRLSERFELFVNCMELSNAYTELNNHLLQEKAFKDQQSDKNNGDDEIPIPDEDFIEALRYGLPPTGGCGIGIDRLIMFVSNHTSIKEVIAFPM